MTKTAETAGQATGQDAAVSPAAYRLEAPRIRRVALAVFLCGPAACVMVTVIGLALLFTLRAADQILLGGLGNPLDSGQPAPLRGAFLASLAATMNGFLFYLTIPAAWLALGLSVGRFPRRGILHARPYWRWGAILGALLVALPTVLGTIAFADDDPALVSMLLGAAVTALGIGGLAGLGCAALFLAIVRPQRQVQRVDADVF